MSLYIREGSTGEIRLLDQLGDPVQDNGRDLVSAPHAAWGGGYLFYQPTTGGTYVVEVRASDDQQTGFYALMVRDRTITASSGDEGRSNSTDFKPFINRAKLHPGDPVSGNLNANGDAHGVLVDEDFFEANLHAGRTYTFTFAASSIRGGVDRELWIAVHGPGTYHNFNNFSPPTSWGGSRTLSITITPHRTGAYVFTIGVFDSVIELSECGEHRSECGYRGIHGDAGGAVARDRTQVGPARMSRAPGVVPALTVRYAS